MVENKGGHPILNFKAATQNDLNSIPHRYLRSKEIRQVTNKQNMKVDFKEEIKLEENSFVHEPEVRTVTKGTRKKLMANLKNALEAFTAGAAEEPIIEPVWHVDNSKSRRKFSIMEICTWTMMVTMVAAQRGWTTWQPVTIETGYDLTTHAGIATAKHDIDKADPDVLVFAWV